MAEENAISKRILEFCTRFDISIPDLQKRAGLSYSTLRATLAGASIPKLMTILKICDGFQIGLQKSFIFKAFGKLYEIH